VNRYPIAIFCGMVRMYVVCHAALPAGSVPVEGAPHHKLVSMLELSATTSTQLRFIRSEDLR